MDFVLKCAQSTIVLKFGYVLSEAQDSPTGVRDADYVTVFPAGINAATTYVQPLPLECAAYLTMVICSWNRELMRARGLAMGREHRAKGVNVALGPMMNMGRVAQGGRNWEGFGADPFLSGEAAYETILGMQVRLIGLFLRLEADLFKGGGVQACAKHYINKWVLRR